MSHLLAQRQGRRTYHCHTGVCSGGGWKSFKLQTRFPSGTVCYLCFAPYGAPFNHEVPPAGSRYKGELCDFPHVLKELAYIIYQHQDVRNTVFARLAHPAPVTTASYWRFISRRRPGGLLGLYEVIAAYLDSRENVA